MGTRKVKEKKTERERKGKERKSKKGKKGKENLRVLKFFGLEQFHDVDAI